MVIIGVDVGKTRTGVAACDKHELLAFPLGVIWQKDRDLLAKKISDHSQKNDAQLIVLGLPVNMDGSRGERCQAIYRFAEILNQYTSTEIEFWDERQTTTSAGFYLNVTDTRGKKRKNVIDAVAAVIILQSYLEYRKNSSKTTTQ